ncbi:LLM class flavin-dependent oxidoreductase [Rhodococcus pyridinivorans]|uniref:LLM class flavin-dependent oxidoreductase n=1 Tax=Rhodococcus pyridinivorans TaxID=103816 RepID=UPI0031F621E3
MREEFELLGQDFDNRGPRLNEMIRALRELWKGGWVSFRGEYYDICLGRVSSSTVLTIR